MKTERSRNTNMYCKKCDITQKYIHGLWDNLYDGDVLCIECDGKMTPSTKHKDDINGTEY